jgi:3-hydroxyacyl-CoA dehydrogenase
MKVENIRKVACVGAGTIGHSWATLFAQKGYSVNLYDVKDELVQNGLRLIKGNLERLVENKIIGKAEADSAFGRIKGTTNLADAVKDVEFVQESAPEDYGVKKKIFKEVDEVARPDTILSSSSSGLLMTEIQKVTENPGRCVISHPFNPPHIMPLVEIVKGEQTSDETVNLDREFMLKLGKRPVVLKKEAVGYIANRLQMALLREAISIVGKGIASATDVDTAVSAGPGLRWALMGPFKVFNLASPGGLEEMFIKFGPAIEPMFKCLDTSLPSLEARKKCVEDIKKELAGKDAEELKQWRGAKLFGELKLLEYK